MMTSCNGAWLFSYHFWSEACYTKLFSESSYLEQLPIFFSEGSSLYIWSAHSSRGDSSVEEDTQTAVSFHLLHISFYSSPWSEQRTGLDSLRHLTQALGAFYGYAPLFKSSCCAASLSQKTSIRTCFRKLKKIQRRFLVLWKQANSEWRSAFVLRWAV